MKLLFFLILFGTLIVSCENGSRNIVVTQDSIKAWTSSPSFKKSMQPIPTGWWVVVVTEHQEASQISFQIGTLKNNATVWEPIWNTGMDPVKPVPEQFRNVKSLYIRATSIPNDRNSYFLVFYNKCVIQKFDFDDIEDHQMDWDNPQRSGLCIQ